MPCPFFAGDGERAGASAARGERRRSGLRSASDVQRVLEVASPGRSHFSYPVPTRVGALETDGVVAPTANLPTGAAGGDIVTIRAVDRAASAILLPTLALVLAKGAAAGKACTEVAAEPHPGIPGATLSCETATNCTGTGSHEPRMDVKLHGVILQPDSLPVSARKFTTPGGEHGDLGGAVVGFGAAVT